jgi:glycosyltransferase involved in cell wall biosynthesis
VPPEDPRALATAIDRLLADDALRGRLGEAAHAAVKPYTYEAMLAAFERALLAAQ